MCVIFYLYPFKLILIIILAKDIFLTRLQYQFDNVFLFIQEHLIPSIKLGQYPKFQNVGNLELRTNYTKEAN